MGLSAAATDFRPYNLLGTTGLTGCAVVQPYVRALPLAFLREQKRLRLGEGRSLVVIIWMLSRTLRPSVPASYR